LRSGGAMTSTLEVQPDIDVAYYDAQGGGIMDATGPFFSERNGWKITSEHLTRTEPTVMMLPFGNSYAFACQGSQTRPSPRYRSQVQMQQCFHLGIPRDLVFCGGSEGIAELCQNSSSVPGEVPARHIQSKDGMRQAYPSTINHKMPVVRPDA
jgi:hypothetical protein